MHASIFKNSFFRTTLAAMVLCFSSCGEDSVLDKTRKVTGVVIDQTSGQPLENVEVQLIADDDNILVRSHEVKDVLTDATGKFEMVYERTEDIYRIELSKPWYAFNQFSRGKNGFPDSYSDFQTLEYFKKEEHFDLPMYALGTLDLTLKNTAPAAGSDVIKITCENCESEKKGIVKAPRTYFFTGNNDQTLQLGAAAGNTYIRLKYQVTHNGQTEHLKDSVYVQPFIHNTFTLTY